MSTEFDHTAEALRLLARSDSPNSTIEWVQASHSAAQVHATLAQAAAAERLAEAVENLPSYEGMLAVYSFGGGKS